MLFAGNPLLPPRLARWGLYFSAAELATGTPAALLAAVCDRESLGGDALRPPGPAGFGDGGHGCGLMQIDDRFHHSFLVARDDNQVLLWTDPAFSILYGAKLLAKNAKACAADWNAAIAAYNCGLMRTKRVLATLDKLTTEEERIAALDKATTGGDYVTDVRRRCFNFTDPAGAA